MRIIAQSQYTTRTNKEFKLRVLSENYHKYIQKNTHNERFLEVIKNDEINKVIIARQKRI